MEREQMTDLVKRLDITIESVRQLPLVAELEEDTWRRDASKWSVTLKRDGMTITTTYWMGSAFKDDPKADDVLASLCIDASCGEQKYEDYLSEFGASDSPRQRTLHKRCQKMATRLKMFLGEHYNAAREAEH